MLFLSVSLCFSLAFLGLPLFQLFSCSLSLSLSLSLYIYIYFFLPLLSFLFFAFFWFLVPFFVSFFVFLSSLLLFHERNNIKIFNCNFFSSILFFWVSYLVFSFKSLFLSLLFFLILSYVFCSTSMFLVSKNQVEKHQFLVKGGVATKRFFFFMNLCFAKCEKLSFFGGGHFWGIFWVMFKNTIKIGISAHF